MSTIITRNSATSGSSPSSLVQGELAINVTDNRLYFGSGSANTVKEFGVTSSYALQALSASYAVSASHEIIKEISSSYADTASFAQSGNGIFSGSFSGSYEGDGSNLTGVDAFPYIGNAVITGSLVVSGSNLTSGFRTDTRNVILGYGAGNNQDATNGPFNVMIGYESGYTNTIGDSNVCIGQYAGYALSTNASDDNIFIGKLAGAGGTSPVARMSDANWNIGLGNESLLFLTSGDYNIGFGYRVMRNISSGQQNIGLGRNAIYNVNSGDNNIGIGYNAGLNQTTGDGNITIGSGSLGIAGESNQLRIGNGNTITTISASLTTGDIIFASTASAEYLSTPAGNLSSISASYALTASHALNAGGGGAGFPFVGDAVITGSLVVSGSGINITSGSITGDGSGLTNISSPSLNDITLGLSTIVGDGASSAANYGTVLGKDATSTGGQNVAIGAFSNVKTFGVSIGQSTVGSTQTVAIGYNVGHTNGEYNVLIGQQSGNNTSGNYNISLGYLAGYYQTTGTGNITIGSGSRGFAGESNQLRIGHGIYGATISASLTTGDIIFASTASAEYLSTPAGNLSSISASYALTASHALNAGGGGAGFPFVGDAVITGSLVVSASATSQSLSVQGSGSTVFDVIGSVGTLFSIDDDFKWYVIYSK